MLWADQLRCLWMWGIEKTSSWAHTACRAQSIPWSWQGWSCPRSPQGPLSGGLSRRRAQVLPGQYLTICITSLATSNWGCKWEEWLPNSLNFLLLCHSLPSSWVLSNPRYGILLSCSSNPEHSPALLHVHYQLSTLLAGAQPALQHCVPAPFLQGCWGSGSTFIWDPGTRKMWRIITKASHWPDAP